MGGEQSGHIVLTDLATTGDALNAALQVLALLVESGKPVSELLREFDPMPQRFENVRYSAGAKPLELEAVKKAIADAEAELNGGGQLLVCPSGTEPVIRVMAEGDIKLRDHAIDQVREAIRRAAVL